MKALSLWQPWASAIARGAKTIETRSWATAYTGPIAIHAARRMIKHEMTDFGCRWNWCGVLGHTMGGGDPPLWESLPFGAIVAVADLVGCVLTDDLRVGELDAPRFPDRQYAGHYSWTERQLGDFSPGRFGWVLANVQPIDPLPYRGAQGLFEIPNSVLPQEVRR